MCRVMSNETPIWGAIGGTEMVATFASMKAPMKRDEARIKRRGHDGLNEQDLRVMAAMQKFGDELDAKEDAKRLEEIRRKQTGR